MATLEFVTESLRKNRLSFQESEQHTIELLETARPTLDALRSFAESFTCLTSEIAPALESFSELQQLVETMIEFRSSLESLAAQMVKSDFNREFFDEMEKFATLLSESEALHAMYIALAGIGTSQTAIESSLSSLSELMAILSTTREQLDELLHPTEY